ncbi:hypothetical protein ACP70R_030075 [Stipagrostis hirtigluma subsp. patula]
MPPREAAEAARTAEHSKSGEASPWLQGFKLEVLDQLCRSELLLLGCRADLGGAVRPWYLWTQ